MNKEQRQAIRKFETWQRKKFASNAKKGYRFFQPDSIATPTPRSSRDAWGGTYTPQNNDDRRQERYIDLLLVALVIAYILFLLWKDF